MSTQGLKASCKVFPLKCEAACTQDVQFIVSLPSIGTCATEIQ